MTGHHRLRRRPPVSLHLESSSPSCACVLIAPCAVPRRLLVETGGAHRRRRPRHRLPVRRVQARASTRASTQVTATVRDPRCHPISACCHRASVGRPARRLRAPSSDALRPPASFPPPSRRTPLQVTMVARGQSTRHAPLAQTATTAAHGWPARAGARHLTSNRLDSVRLANVAPTSSPSLISSSRASTHLAAPPRAASCLPLMRARVPRPPPAPPLTARARMRAPPSAASTTVVIVATHPRLRHRRPARPARAPV